MLSRFEDFHKLYCEHGSVVAVLSTDQIDQRDYAMMLEHYPDFVYLLELDDMPAMYLEQVYKAWPNLFELYPFEKLKPFTQVYLACKHTKLLDLINYESLDENNMANLLLSHEHLADKMDVSRISPARWSWAIYNNPNLIKHADVTKFTVGEIELILSEQPQLKAYIQKFRNDIE